MGLAWLKNRIGTVRTIAMAAGGRAGFRGGVQNGSRAPLVDQGRLPLGVRGAGLLHPGLLGGFERVAGARARSAGQRGAGGALPDALDVRTDDERDPEALGDRLRGLVRGAAPAPGLARAPGARLARRARRQLRA